MTLTPKQRKGAIAGAVAAVVVVPLGVWAGASALGDNNPGSVFGVSMESSKAEPQEIWNTAYRNTFEDTNEYSTKSYINTTDEDAAKIFDLMNSDTPQIPKTVKNRDALIAAQKKQQETSKQNFIKLFRGTSVSMSMKTPDGVDKKLGEVAPNENVDYNLTVDVAGSPLVFTSKNGELYAQTDLKGVGSKTGLYNAETVNNLSTQVGSRFAWMDSLLKGQPIKFDADSTKKVVESSGAKLSSNNDTQKQLVNVLNKNSTYTDGGSEGDLGRVIYTDVKLKPFVNDLDAVLRSDAQKRGEKTVETSPLKDAVKDFKDDSVLRVKSYIKKDNLTRFEVDLTQIRSWFDVSKVSKPNLADVNKLKALNFEASFVTDISETANITVPTNAVTVPAGDVAKMTEEAPGTTVDSTTKSGGKTPAPTTKPSTPAPKKQ